MTAASAVRTPPSSGVDKSCRTSMGARASAAGTPRTKVPLRRPDRLRKRCGAAVSLRDRRGADRAGNGRSAEAVLAPRVDLQQEAGDFHPAEELVHPQQHSKDWPEQHGIGGMAGGAACGEPTWSDSACSRRLGGNWPMPLDSSCQVLVEIPSTSVP